MSISTTSAPQPTATEDKNCKWEYRVFWKVPDAQNAEKLDSKLEDFRSFAVLSAPSASNTTTQSPQQQQQQQQVPSSSSSSSTSSNDNVTKDDAEDEYVYMPADCFPQDRPPWVNIKLRRDGNSYKLKAKFRHNRLQNKFSVFGPESEIWKLGKLSKEDVLTLSKVLFPLDTDTEAGYRRAWLESLDDDSFKDRDNFKKSMSKYLGIMRAARQGLTPDSDEFRRMLKDNTATSENESKGSAETTTTTSSASGSTSTPAKATSHDALPACHLVRVQKKRRKQSMGPLDAEYSELRIEPEDGKAVGGNNESVQLRTFLVESHDSVPLKQFVEKLEMSYGQLLQGRNSCCHDYISLMDSVLKNSSPQASGQSV